MPVSIIRPIVEVLTVIAILLTMPFHSKDPITTFAGLPHTEQFALIVAVGLLGDMAYQFARLMIEAVSRGRPRPTAAVEPLSRSLRQKDRRSFELRLKTRNISMNIRRTVDRWSA
jgi:hypothetical protein